MTKSQNFSTVFYTKHIVFLQYLDMQHMGGGKKFQSVTVHTPYQNHLLVSIHKLTDFKACLEYMKLFDRISRRSRLT